MTTKRSIGRLVTACISQTLWSVEQQELAKWAELAQAGPDAAGASGAGEGQRVCRMPFNVVGVNRAGQRQLQRATSHSLGARRAVLVVRRPLALYETVVVQLDDGGERPWVRAKVLDNTQTVGGYYALVEFLAWEQRAA